MGFFAYLPNKHSFVLKGNWGPSAPFLLITTILPTRSFMAADATFKVLILPIPNEKNGRERALITEECLEMKRANVNGQMNSNGYSQAFDFSASTVDWTKLNT